MGTFAWELSLWNSRLGTVTWELRLGPWLSWLARSLLWQQRRSLLKRDLELSCAERRKGSRHGTYSSNAARMKEIPILQHATNPSATATATRSFRIGKKLWSTGRAALRNTLCGYILMLGSARSSGHAHWQRLPKLCEWTGGGRCLCFFAPS